MIVVYLNWAVMLVGLLMWHWGMRSKGWISWVACVIGMQLVLMPVYFLVRGWPQ